MCVTSKPAADGVSPPTAAVLVRRNADAAPIADALRARGIPVEVVGLAGLLSVPEVADVVAMLRLVADPTAGAAAMRVLTGPRWRLGARDIAALWRRAVALGGGQSAEAATPESIAMAAGPDADSACLADAISDPGPADSYSAAGYQRICALAGELLALRGHLGHSLPDLVAEVRRVLGVDCEVRAVAAAGWSGAEHLDAFADVVAGYAERAPTTPSAPSVAGLLSYLDAAEVVENGLAPAQLAVARDRVQVLTVHAAKGLEWQVVAVAHLSGGVFPSTASRSSWLTDAAELPPLLRGDRAQAGALGIPVLDTSDVTNRKQLSDKISEHRRQLDQRRVDEERRLLYVGITRAEDTLLVSGHHWGCTGIKPRGPSDFLCELKDVIDRSAAAGDPCGVVEQWAPAPADGERNPLRDSVVEAMWPADPLAGRRGDVERGAALVAGMMSADTRLAVEDVDGWVADVDALLAERAQRRTTACRHPAQPVVGQRAGGPGPRPGGRGAAADASAADPSGPACVAGQRVSRLGAKVLRRGVAVRSWRPAGRGGLRRRRHRGIGRAAGGLRPDRRGRPAHPSRSRCRSRCRSATPCYAAASTRCSPTPTAVRPSWTGKPASRRAGRKPCGRPAVQLAVYRLAWAALSGCPESSVRTAFYYVRTGVTVVPDELPDPAELAALLAVSDGCHS